MTRPDPIGGSPRVLYDHLILATGARHAYLGTTNGKRPAPGLKKIEDATELRRHILNRVSSLRRPRPTQQRAPAS